MDGKAGIRRDEVVSDGRYRDGRRALEVGGGGGCGGGSGGGKSEIMTALSLTPAASTTQLLYATRFYNVTM